MKRGEYGKSNRAIIFGKMFWVHASEWKVSKYGTFSGPYFPVFGPNTGKYGPEKTPHLDTFHAVLWNQLIALSDYWRNYINKHKLISWESNSWVFTMVFKDAVHWNISRKYRFKFYPRFAKFHVKVLWEKIKDCSILCTNIF